MAAGATVALGEHIRGHRFENASRTLTVEFGDEIDEIFMLWPEKAGMKNVVFVEDYDAERTVLSWHQKKTVESTEEFEVFKIDKSTTYKFKLQPADPTRAMLTNVETLEESELTAVSAAAKHVRAELKEARHRERNGLNAGWHAQPDSSSSQQFKKDRIDASTSRRFKGDCMEVIVGERTDDVRVVWWPDEKDPVETVVEVEMHDRETASLYWQDRSDQVGSGRAEIFKFTVDPIDPDQACVCRVDDGYEHQLVARSAPVVEVVVRQLDNEQTRRADAAAAIARQAAHEAALGRVWRQRELRTAREAAEKVARAAGLVGAAQAQTAACVAALRSGRATGLEAERQLRALPGKREAAQEAVEGAVHGQAAANAVAQAVAARRSGREEVLRTRARENRERLVGYAALDAVAAAAAEAVASEARAAGNAAEQLGGWARAEAAGSIGTGAEREQKAAAEATEAGLQAQAVQEAAREERTRWERAERRAAAHAAEQAAAAGRVRAAKAGRWRAREEVEERAAQDAAAAATRHAAEAAVAAGAAHAVAAANAAAEAERRRAVAVAAGVLAQARQVQERLRQAEAAKVQAKREARFNAKREARRKGIAFNNKARH